MEKTTLFFVQTPAAEGRLLLCRWVEAFYEAGRRVQIAVESSIAARNIDGLLWTFAQESFVPHAMVASGEEPERMEPVIISIGEVFRPGFQVLVSDLGVPDLDFLLRYPVGVHFVIQDDAERRQESRLLWMAARDRSGVVLQHVPHPAVPCEILSNLSARGTRD